MRIFLVSDLIAGRAAVRQDSPSNNKLIADNALITVAFVVDEIMEKRQPMMDTNGRKPISQLISSTQKMPANQTVRSLPRQNLIEIQ